MEQIPRVVRSWAGFGVVLDTERRNVRASQTFKGPIIEAYMSFGNSWHRTRFNGEVVILAGDFNPATFDVAHWDVAPMMTELHLV